MSLHRAKAAALLLAFVALAQALHFALEPTRVLGGAFDLLESPGDWLTSPALSIEPGEEGVRLRALGAAVPAAARAVPVSARSDFLLLKACSVEPLGLQGLGMLLASARGDTLDFNRHYGFRAVYLAQDNRCAQEVFSRLPNDGDAFLQLRLDEAASGLLIASLSLTELEEVPLWRVLRVLMLWLGLALLAAYFWRYLQARPRALACFGLLGVAGIVFGCCVSVGLKAQIYALFYYGSGEAIPATAEALLEIASPGQGFSIFTTLHAVLFFAATLILGLCDKRAVLDLCLLAVVTETLQLFVPGRGPGVSDVLVDLSGVILACLVLLPLWRSKRISLFLQK